MQQLDKSRQVVKRSPCLFMYMSFQVTSVISTTLPNSPKSDDFWRGPSWPLICIGLQVVGYFDQIAIFAKFAKFAGFTRGLSCLLPCISLQVVGDFDQFAIFAKFARFAGFPRGPSCLFICTGLQVVVGEILLFLPFLLLCAFLDISQVTSSCHENGMAGVWQYGRGPWSPVTSSAVRLKATFEPECNKGNGD